MSNLTLALELAGETFQLPSLPGNQPTQGNNVLLGNQAPSQSIGDLKQVDGSTVTWSFSRAADAGAWVTTTYPVAMVFQMILAAEAGHDAPSGSLPCDPKDPTCTFEPSSIFSSQSGLTPSTISWASSSGSVFGGPSRAYVDGSSFTYLVDPPSGGIIPITGSGSTYSWSLTVDWDQVEASTLAVSYPTSSQTALALKYRLYCFSGVFGLWYIDPELDLCPQG